MAQTRSFERAGVALLAMALTLPSPIIPAQITVDDDCTLPDAVAAANTDSATGGCPAGAGADTLRLTADVDLTAAIPTVTSEIALDGQGFTVTNDVGHSGRFFNNVSTLTLTNLTLSGGNADNGGAIHNVGTLRIEDSFLIDNDAGSDGGALFNNGSAVLVNTTIAYNSAGDDGGGIYGGWYGSTSLIDSNLDNNDAFWFGGGLFGYSTGLTLSNSTVSGNQPAGLTVFYAFDPVTITNSTISGNAGRGLHTIGGPDSGGTVRVENTTFFDNGSHMYHEFYGLVAVADNIFADPGGDPCNGGFFVDEGGNVDSNGSCADGIVLTGFDPVLADNGGPTRTHALLAGSSAIDTAGDCGRLVDQRGFGRDADCDSGSFEYDGAPAVTSSVGGLRIRDTRCSNLTTGETADFVARSWNCRSEGLAIDPGDRVQQSVRGRPSAADLTGTFSGVVSVRVVCQNFTSGQTAQFQLGGATGFSCRDQGLLFSPGDTVGWRLTGFAE